MQSIKDKPGFLIRQQYEEEQKIERLRRLKFSGYTEPDVKPIDWFFIPLEPGTRRILQIVNGTYVCTGIEKIPIVENETVSMIEEAVDNDMEEIESYSTYTLNFENEINDSYLSESSDQEDSNDSQEEPDFLIFDNSKIEEVIANLYHIRSSQTCQSSLKSELHSVSHMQSCILLGGNKKKRKPIKRNKRVIRRKPLLNGIPRNLIGNDIMPPFKIVTLDYVDPLMQISAPTQSFVVKSLRINALFDPDPAVLTSGVGGFNELMLFYEFFKVMRTTVSWEPANNESFAVMVGYIFSNVNLSSLILTRQDAIDALENGITTQAFTLQNRTGGPSSRNITRTLMPKHLLGDPSLYDGDVNYTGTSNTDPPDLLFVNLIVISPSNLTLLLNGTVGKLKMRYKARLFGRRYLNDALRDRKKLSEYSMDELREAMKLASLKNIDEAFEKRR